MQRIQIENKIKSLTNVKLTGKNPKLLVIFYNNIKNLDKIFKEKIIFEFKKKYFEDYKNVRIFESISYYYNLNYKKLKKIEKNDYYINDNNVIIIIDIRYLKPRIFIIRKNKCILSLTSGIVYKKLALKQKKIKKTEKMLNLMLKAVSSNLRKINFFKNCIIHLKGTRSNLFNILVLIERNFNSKTISLLYSPHINHGDFKFKKIKSIKKRLRKKFTRLIKN